MSPPPAAPVLLPGLHGSDALWSRLMDAWGGPLHPVSYRGLPLLTLAQHADHVERSILARTGPSEPVDVIAESFSGPIALALIQRQRVRIRRVVLTASFATVPHPWLCRLLAKLPAAIVRRLMTARRGVQSRLANGAADPALIDDVMQALADVAPAELSGRLRLLAGLTPPASPCATPVLYLQASDDRLVSPAGLESVRRACHRLSVVRIAGPHLLLQASPVPCVAAIRSFLAQDEAR